MSQKFYLGVVALALLLFNSCAPKNWDSEAEGAFDPLEGINRTTYKFNKGMDFILLKPAATVFQKFPSPVKTGVNNFFNNLSEPTVATNKALQKKGDDSLNSVTRFVVNSTFGIGGLFDVATMWDVPQPSETDFGQTLRGYGMHDSVYFVLPLLGPSTFSDSIGSVGDNTLSPINYIDSDKVRYSIYALGAINTRSNLLPTTDLIEEIALDEYSFVRDAYEEQRKNNIPTGLWEE